MVLVERDWGLVLDIEAVAISRSMCSRNPSCRAGIESEGRVAAALSIKPGTLDDTSWLDPDAHYWIKSKQPWVPIPGGVRCVEDDG